MRFTRTDLVSLAVSVLALMAGCGDSGTSTVGGPDNGNDCGVTDPDGTGLPLCGKTDSPRPGINCRAEETDDGGADPESDAGDQPADTGTEPDVVTTNPCEPFEQFVGHWVCKDPYTGLDAGAMVSLRPADDGVCTVYTRLLTDGLQGNPDNPYGLMSGREGATAQFTQDGELHVAIPSDGMIFICTPDPYQVG